MAIVGVTAVAQIVMVSTHFTTSTFNSVVGTDAALVRMFVTSALSPDDLTVSASSNASLADLDRRLATLIEAGKILQIEVRRPDGRIIASSQPRASGMVADASPDFTAALVGDSAVAGIVGTPESEAVGPALGTTDVLREYFPLVIDGQVRAVVAVWRDAVPILLQLEELRRNIVLVTLSAGIIAGLVLYFVFRNAQTRISRQATSLVDATQHDQLTGA